jgi:hypothetical protein
MCAAITDTADIAGSAKGARGWFRVDHVNLGYDHPTHLREEHAVTLDFVDVTGIGDRVAIELDIDRARELAAAILATVERAQTYERGTAHAHATPRV